MGSSDLRNSFNSGRGHHPLDDSRYVPPTDVVAVFTGGQGRVREALNTFLANPDSNSVLYISGVGADINIHDVLRVNGQPNLPSSILSRIHYDRASSTEENAILTAQFLDKHNFTSVTLMTSEAHMPRALMLLQRAMREEDHVVPIITRPVENGAVSFVSRVAEIVKTGIQSIP